MYRPNNVPDDPKEIPSWLNREVWLIAQAIEGARDYSLLKIQHAPPVKTVEGMFLLADGVDWNPGSGAGMYRFQGGTYKFVG